MKKLFGGLNITWTKLIIWAIIAGVYTAVMAILPITRDTSFRDIAVTFEVWILFGILIITNSKSPKESALKCFVFFLISQPLVYLLQVPFSWQGWGLFKYYGYWFVWTCLCIPMGYIGYYMRSNKWWGLLILTPMIIFLGSHYYGFLSEAYAFFPNHLLTAIFCAVTMILYSLFIFDNKVLRIIETVISLILIIGLTSLVVFQPKTTYHTQFGIENVEIKENTKVWLEDSKYGTLTTKYEENLEEYLIDANFTDTGATKIYVQNDDKKCEANITINRYSYEIVDVKCE